jgi:CSLREA domain-containing protein
MDRLETARDASHRFLSIPERTIKMFRKRTRRNQKRFITALALAGFLLIAGVSLSRHLRNWIQPTAHAATFTVTNAEDHTGDPCTVAECTLREAIEAVNAGSGGDTISFNIPHHKSDIGVTYTQQDRHH